MEKVTIFIDGANFYNLVLKKLGSRELYFDFDAFAHFLANGRKIVEMGKRFYIGAVSEQNDDPKSKEAMSNQTALFNILKKSGWELKTSKLRKRFEEIIIDNRVVDFQEIQKRGIYAIQYQRLREKGIDVKIATDLIVGAVDDKYDTAIVVSSDGDLLPAIDWVTKRKQKKIEYIGFSILDEEDERKSTKPLLSMISKTDIQRTLIVSDLKPFLQVPISNKKLFQKVKELDLPLGRYALFGSAPMGVRGLKECQDIDIIVNKELWDKFSKKLEWEKKKSIDSGSEYLQNNDIELWKDWKAGARVWDIENLISEAEIIDDLPFVKLERVLEWKKSNGRNKDIKDLKIIKIFTR